MATSSTEADQHHLLFDEAPPTEATEVPDESDDENDVFTDEDDDPYFPLDEEDEPAIMRYRNVAEDRSAITSYSVPQSVSSLGNSTFYACANLTTVIIPDACCSIGRLCFASCVSLENIILPSNISELNNSTFESCRSLRSIKMPESVNRIGNFCFAGCHILTSVVLSPAVTSIGDHGFFECRSLVSVEIPAGVTAIGSWAFFGCGSLAYITIPDSAVADIHAFGECTELERIATEEGLSIEEWGKRNWRKAEAARLALELRRSIVSCIGKLQEISDDDLEAHLETIDGPQIVKDCVRFVIQVGEPGLMREIVRFAA
jgi:hypothetical protein